MAYIGIQPAEKFTSFATQEFSTSATTSYTLDHAVANENELALFVNNVRQQPGSGKAYTATGTALTLSAATASTDTMYCVFLGRALQTVVPATNSITAGMIGDTAISGKDALTAEPADTDEFLVSDAGTLKRIDYSLIKGGGITEADMWYLTSNLSTTSSEAVITSNLSRAATKGFSVLGTGMAVSSGAWTFPSTGFWLVQANAQWEASGNTGYHGLRMYVTDDNSSYTLISNANAGAEAGYYMNSSSNTIIDVTNTTNVKLKFYAISSANSTLRGTSSYKYTGFTFIRLGDT